MERQEPVFVRNWRQALGQLASATGAIVRTFGAIGRDQGNLPVVSSPAAREAADAEASAPGTARQVESARRTADLFLFHASDHLVALGRLLQNGPTAFATTAVGRAGTEGASIAWWLLDPDITWRIRVARNLALRLHSLKEAATIPDAGSVRAAEEMRARIQTS